MGSILTDPDVQRVGTTGDAARVMGSIGHHGWVSMDAGQTWALMNTGLDTIDDPTVFAGGYERVGLPGDRARPAVVLEHRRRRKAGRVAAAATLPAPP